jgi:hypothetical protein
MIDYDRTKLKCNRVVNKNNENCIVSNCIYYENKKPKQLTIKDCEIFNNTNNVEYYTWKQYIDPEVGATYWYNHSTGEATWINPSEREEYNPVYNTYDDAYYTYDDAYYKHDDAYYTHDDTYYPKSNNPKQFRVPKIVFPPRL